MIPNLCRFVCLLSIDSFSLEPISVVVKEQEQKLKDSEATLSSLQVNFVPMSFFIFSQVIRVAGRMLNTVSFQQSNICHQHTSSSSSSFVKAFSQLYQSQSYMNSCFAIPGQIIGYVAFPLVHRYYFHSSPLWPTPFL